MISFPKTLLCFLRKCFTDSKLFSDCGNPAPDNGQSDTPEGTTYGSVAGVSCNDGYVLSGDAILTCKSGPQWSDNSTCIRGIRICLFLTLYV